MSFASLGGVELSNKVSYDKKVKYYGELNRYFSEGAPKEITKDYYMPKWEDDIGWKKIHNYTRGRIAGKGSFSNYQETRDACYSLVKDKKFESCTSPSETWCSDCAWFKK